MRPKDEYQQHSGWQMLNYDATEFAPKRSAGAVAKIKVTAIAVDENEWKPFDMGYQIGKNNVEIWGSCTSSQVLYLTL